MTACAHDDRPAEGARHGWTDGTDRADRVDRVDRVDRADRADRADQVDGGDHLDLRHVLVTMRRRAVLVGGVVLVVLALTVTGDLLRGPEYRSTTRVLLVDGVRDGGVPPLWDVDTEVLVARSADVAGAAGAALVPPRDATWVADRVVVRPASGQLLAIRASGGTAQDAATLATAYREAYLTFTRARSAAQVDAVLAVVDDRLADVEARIADVAALQQAVDVRRSADGLSAEERFALGAQADELVRQRLQLEAEAERLRQQDATIRAGRDARDAGLETVQQATVPSRPAEPDLLADAAIAVAAGAFAGVLMALVLDQVQGRVRSWAEVEASAGAPVLAAVAAVPRRAGRVAGLHRELTRRRPPGDEVEVLDAVLDRVPLDGAGAPGTLVVLGVEGDRASAVVAVRLATLCALDGLPTGLVDDSEPAGPLGQVLREAAARGSQPGRSDRAGAGWAPAGGFTVVHRWVGRHPVRFPAIERPTVVLAADADRLRRHQARAVARTCADAGWPLAGVVLLGGRPDRTAVPSASPELRPVGWAEAVAGLRAATRQPLCSLTVRRFRAAGWRAATDPVPVAPAGRRALVSATTDARDEERTA